MVRFWLTLGIACLFALVGYGLISAWHGRMVNIDGQWLGNLPLAGGEDCRIKIYPTGVFDFECRGQTTYAAKGSWEQRGDNLKFIFSFFAQNSQFPKRLPEPWVFSVQAKRNELHLGQSSDQGLPYKWKRAPL